MTKMGTVSILLVSSISVHKINCEGDFKNKKKNESLDYLRHKMYGWWKYK